MYIHVFLSHPSSPVLHAACPVPVVELDPHTSDYFLTFLYFLLLMYYFSTSTKTLT